MNQQTVIYIILSAILLYLYYKRGGIAIFVAFVVVVAGTLFASGSAGAREGLSVGGVGKGDKECAKMGFTAPKIDKKDIKGSLEKILKNFKKVVEPYADVGRGFDIGKSGKEYKAITEMGSMGSAKDIQTKWQEDKNNNLSELLDHSFRLFDPYIFTPSEEQQQKFIDGKLSELVKNKEVKKIINGGNRLVKMLEDIKKLDETKELDKKAKAFLNAAICAFKQTVLIWKSLDKAMGSSGGGEDDEGEDDEEEKPKKKKKKVTKKKKKSDEDDEDEE